MLQDFDFLAPRTLEEACFALASGGGRLIAGGTDVIPQLLNGRLRASCLVDLSRLTGLSFIGIAGGRLRVGALTTFAQLADSDVIARLAPVLGQAAATVGSVQTRQRATLGGNIANASPAGDALPALLVLDAQVVLASVRGKRTVKLTDLLRGPGRTAIAADEIIHHVECDMPGPRTTGLYLKLGNRRGMAIAVASAAAWLERAPDGRITRARLALGSVAPTAIRCRAAEELLSNALPGEAVCVAAAQAAAAACTPIDDLRASAAYRRHAAEVLVRRCLQGLLAG
jgi:CO/xanthine dehydrogenase FAD-binding subunit